MKNLLTAKDCLLFLSGYGNGYGDGNGYGYGYGYGDGYGYGNGDGYGNGYGYGYGYGNGNGNGNGYGYGDGNGDGNGDGYGDGYGNGNGDGDGDGDGNFALPHPYYIVDGIWCEFLQIHGNYARVNIIDMYCVNNCKPAWIARDGDKYAHGETLHEAQESLIYKISDRDTGRYADWKLDDVKTKSELIGAYRVITGACEFGTRQFCNGRDLPDKCTIREAIKLIAGQYGAERFAEFFNV